MFCQQSLKLCSILAIHGIGADPDNTWTGRGPNDEKINWLTHPGMLPKAVPTARIMRFGYESGWYGTAKDNPKKTYVFDVAEMLLSQLELYRRDNIRPIIFLAHSYGGLVLMQALRRSFDNPDRWSNIFRHTAGLIFFGTPFRGRQSLSLEQLVEAVADRSPNSGHPDSGKPDFRVYSETMALSVEENRYLQDIVDRFTESRRGDHPLPLWCFYELLPSPIKKVLWTPELEDDYLVPKESACLDNSKGVERYPLERHHYNLQKFPGPADPGYQAVTEAIMRLASGAREYIGECSAISKKGHFLVPFGRNEAFVGRKDIIDNLLKRVPPVVQPHDCQRTALEGLGGVGKTQIALETAYRVHSTYPDCSIFWVPALDSEISYKAYREIGEALGVKGIDNEEADVRGLVHAVLARDDIGPWLLILDNADDQELLFEKQAILKDLPFNRHGSILVTTRNHEVAVMLDVSHPGLLKVESMHRDESSELLRQGLKYSQTCDIPSTENLLGFLADLPLAIKQASAYLAKTSMSTTQYLAHCQSSDKAKIKLMSTGFNDRGRYNTAQNPITTTWLISFEHIKRDSPLAADYLRFISFFLEKNIPKSILPMGDDRLAADEAFGTLLAYAFVTERTGTNCFDVHRLVRLATRNWIADNGEQSVWRA
ncbi:P-loop containing nucleoside triphosphate hydrolase protein [Nemania sp. FL0916]|nr:P-loop containing nucleoside triphosphate hydrolase protein [Nemania sp. FL0916]